MYNSSLKGHGGTSAFKNCIEIPHKIFFNDMSKSYMRDEFKTCDVIYSEIAWPYGYKGFNEKAGNVPGAYSDYVDNINLAIEELDVPAFIVCGKNVKRHFPKARMYPITFGQPRRENRAAVRPATTVRTARSCRNAISAMAAMSIRLPAEAEADGPRARRRRSCARRTRSRP